jgi:hypothetical protein
MDAVWEWFRVLHATTGIKLTMFYDAFDRARFFNGLLTSLRLMTLCLVCSVVIGVIGAWLQGARKQIRASNDAGLHPIHSQHATARSALFLLFRARRPICGIPTRPGWKSPLSPISSGP